MDEFWDLVRHLAGLDPDVPIRSATLSGKAGEAPRLVVEIDVTQKFGFAASEWKTWEPR